MRKLYSNIYCFFIVLLAFQSAYGQNKITDSLAQDSSVQQTDWRIVNLVTQAKELFEAYDNCDYVKFVELSHPNIYKEKGSENFLEYVRIVTENRFVNYEPLPTTIETPIELFDIDKKLFSVVPYKLNAIGKVKKEKLVALGSMVGISEDGGKSWRFVKGVAFNEAFPNVIGMFLIPNPIEKRFINDIEQ